MFNARAAVVLLCGFWIEKVLGGGTLEVEFLTYSNPSHDEYDGGCCEPSFFGFCVNDCDNYFELCYREYSATSGCKVHLTTKTIMSDNDDFNFPTGSGVFGNGISNPVQFSFTGAWPNSVGLLVTVWDDDGDRSGNDKIDVFYIRTSNAPLTTKWTSAVISGRRATIKLRYRVRCALHWYHSCDVYCKPQNNYLGHYNCTSNGTKICFAGWEGANCDQQNVRAAEALQCLASEGCVADSTGQARCIPISKPPLEYKPFSCSKCHKYADCIADSYCRCRPGYVGNGKQCCSGGMGGQVAVTSSNVYFRCDSDCDVPYSNATWYKNEALLKTSRDRYGVANNGMILLLGNLTEEDTAEYTCQIQVDGTIFKRYGSLEVLDVRKTILASSASCSLDCGKSCARKPFVAGGVLTYAGQFPWQAMLCSPPQGQYCGGVLVSSDCIVTAAHCIVEGGNHAQDMTICLGRQCGNCSEKDSQGKPQCFKPHSVAVHPQYDSGTLNNDIAVIKLGQSPIMDCSRVYPVCLPNETRDASYIRAHKYGIVTGWGRVNSTVSRSRCLRKGLVRLASRRICDLRHSKYPVTAKMMCATDYNGACEGDSGGPLVVKNEEYGGRFVLAGIVSWGIGCGDVTKLGVYTNVLSHLDWIKKTCGI